MRRKIKSDDVGMVLVPPLGIATRRSTEVTAIEDRLVAKAVQLIRENACAGLEVTALMQMLGVSRSVFYRRFCQAVRRSPHHEILRVQLDRVRNLLVQTDLSVEKISEMAGFKSPDYLSVAFKRELRMTPGEYRKQNRRS
jgi:LacI family transcriptional regulator